MQTILPELKVKAVVLGDRMRIVIAANLVKERDNLLDCDSVSNQYAFDLLGGVKISEHQALADLTEIQIF